MEFDRCGVTAVNAINNCGYKSIMINCNPETVSTDYDICDKLYFEELTIERVLDICEKENPEGVIVSTGGQVPNNLAMKLYKKDVKILTISNRCLSSITMITNSTLFRKNRLDLLVPDYLAVFTVNTDHMKSQISHLLAGNPSNPISAVAGNVQFAV